MRLTKKKAIELTIELWEWLAKTGKWKEDWPDWNKYGGLDEWESCDNVAYLCFLCEYTGGMGSICDSKCPYGKMFGRCTREKSPFDLWASVQTNKTRKKYAREFLEQVKALKK